MAYKQVRRRTQRELGQHDGATPEVSHAPEVSQIQTDRDLMTADDALALQDVVGNRATGQLMGAASPPAPPPTGYIQSKPIPPQPSRPGGSLHTPAYAHFRRKPTLQRASWDGSFDTNADFESQVNQQSGGGKPLPSDVRADLEPKFGADFSGVKIHADANAAQLSQDVGAQAFTHGSDIYFNQGKYNPESSSGKHLLAHELTHTVQQGGSGVQRHPYQRVPAKLTVGPASNKVIRSILEGSNGANLQQGSKEDKRGFVQRHGNHNDDEISRKPLKIQGAATTIQRAPVESYGGTFSDVRYEGAQGHKQVGAIIDLEFSPNELIQSPKIGLTQTVKALKNNNVDVEKIGNTITREDLRQRMQSSRGSDKGRFLDRGAPKDLRSDKHFYQENPIFGMENQPDKDNRTLGGATSRTIKANRLGGEDVAHPDVKAGQYGSRDDKGNITPATLHDEPGRPVGGNIDMKFETAAVVLEGNQKGAYLGSVEWGFRASGENPPVLYPFKLLSKGTPTKAFMKSVELWNNQTDLEMLTKETKIVGKPSKLEGEKRSFLQLFETRHETKTLDLDNANYKDKIETLNKRIKAIEKELARRNRLTPNDVANKELELQGLKRQREEVYGSITTDDARIEFRKLKSSLFTSASQRKIRAIEMMTQSPSKGVEIQQAYDAVFTPEKFETIAKAHFESMFKGFGADVDEYQKLLGKYPPEFKTFIDAGAKAAVPIDQYNALTAEHARRVRRGQGLSPYIVSIAQQYIGNPTELREIFMGILKGASEADVTEIEKDYNEVIPSEVGLDAPATLGQMVSDYFMQYFNEKGGSIDVYKKLSKDFKPLQYRIKPAYRLTFGEDELQKILKKLKQEELEAAVPDPDSEGNQIEKFLFEWGGPYKVDNFTSSTSLGMFNASYEPMSEELKITVKLAFTFRDLNTQGSPLVTAPTKVVDPSFLKATWDQHAKAPWIQSFKDQINNIWNGKVTLRCIKPGWEDIVARPIMQVEEVPLGQEHFKVNVDKAALLSEGGNEKMKTEGGSSFADIKTRTAQLREFDLVDKIGDPSVHHYLHEGEKKGSIKPAYELDRRRLETTLAQFGKLKCQPNAQGLLEDMDFTRLSDSLKALGVPSDLSHLHPIEISGSVATGESLDLAKKRADYLKLVLTYAGIRNTITTKTNADNFAGVTVKAGPVDPQVLDDYVRNWNRISAAHEFGHMIGLADEYNPAASLETVKKLISDGLLPPDTRTDHLSEKGSQKAGAQGEKQKAFMKMLDEHNMYSPGDFAPDQTTPMSTSLMTGGYKIMSQHFITIWEVLGHITEPAGLGRKFWQIE